MPYATWTSLLAGSLLVVGLTATAAQAPVVVQASRGRAPAADVRRAVAVLLVVGGLLFALWQTLTTGSAGWSVGNIDARNVNLEPWVTVDLYLHGWAAGDATAVRNLVGNLLLLAPVGMGLAIHPRVRPLAVPLVLVGLSTTIELAQLPLARSSDVDDVLLNSIGGTLAAVLVWSLLLLTTHHHSSREEH